MDMALNPLHLMQLQQLFHTCKANHPKLPLFFQAAARDALMEGTIIEINVKSPDGKEYCTNMKLTSSDLELLQALKQLSEQN